MLNPSGSSVDGMYLYGGLARESQCRQTSRGEIFVQRCRFSEIRAAKNSWRRLVSCLRHSCILTLALFGSIHLKVISFESECDECCSVGPN